MKVLSGIQPTGRPHWGNYFGAIRQYIDLQESEQAFYFVANLHALTTIRDKEVLAGYTMDAAMDLLALGLDPEKAVLFVQSDVPEISELCWLLQSGAPMGQLERCVAYKDKASKGIATNVGLFAYPILHAADILAFDSDTVPVGEDQVQHIELCRDLAASWNAKFGETFSLPKPNILKDTGKVVGTDGEKMSKSYGNAIEVFETPKKMRKQINRIATDSREMEEPKDPEGDHLIALLKLFASAEEVSDMEDLYRKGGFGYGQVKKAIADAADKYLAEPRERRAELEANPEKVRKILDEGAQRAREKAREVLDRARRACGLVY